VIKTLEAQLGQFLLGCKCLVSAGQLIVADTENALQISIQKLETVTSKYGIKVETSARKQWILKE
jgi:hypothetical protein